MFLNKWNCLVLNQITDPSGSVLSTQTSSGTPGLQHEVLSQSPLPDPFNWNCQGLKLGPSVHKPVAPPLRNTPISNLPWEQSLVSTDAESTFCVSAKQISCPEYGDYLGLFWTSDFSSSNSISLCSRTVEVKDLNLCDYCSRMHHSEEKYLNHFSSTDR